MPKMRALICVALLFFFLILHTCLSFAMCDKNIRHYPRYYNVNEKLFDSSEASPLSQFTHQTYITEDIFTSEKLFFNHNKFVSPKIRYKFPHGPYIEYGLSMKRHALSLKFRITTKGK